VPSISFETTVQDEDGGILLEIPGNLVAALGKGKRPPVRASLNGYTHRTTVSVYGGRSFIPVRREIREAANLSAGDTLSVTLELDQEPRTVDVPDDLARALDADAAAQAAFETLAYTHRKDYVEWVTPARRAETRRRRVEKAVARLREGRKEP
jgi:hypothetical protein